MARAIAVVASWRAWLDNVVSSGRDVSTKTVSSGRTRCGGRCEKAVRRVKLYGYTGHNRARARGYRAGDYVRNSSGG